ncbi:MAG: ABC transporter permease [Dehalococcoidia bacterium]|nr:ABC transporter permease [Dehalococcoidia bacterium]MCC6269587.1 ABC transporter permease [Dehalococcoidia bacterium]
MARYMARRALMLPVLLFLVSIAVFAIVRLIPGDPAEAILSESTMLRKQDLDQLRKELGLNDPLPVAYGKWLGHLARGDLGNSLATDRPVTDMLRQAVPVSLELALFGLVISVVTGVSLGIVSAVWKDSPGDVVARLVAILWLSLPGFWLGTLLIVFGARWFEWVPPVRYQSLADNPSQNLELFLPAAIVLGLHSAAVTMRYTRSGLLEVLRQDYIRTARAKGLRDSAIYMRHALRNALLPVVTVAGLQFAVLLGGSVTLEAVFNLPGVGRLLIAAIRSRDYPVIQGAVLYIGAMVIFVNFLVDLSYVALNPRLRTQS